MRNFLVKKSISSAMKHKILFSLLLISSTVFSQAPGYLGKRLVVGYSNYFIPGFIGPGSLNSYPSGQSSFTINNAHCLNLEYAFSSGRMICISGEYFRTGIAYDKGVHNGFLNFQSTGDYPYLNTYKYGGDFYTPALLISRNIGIGLKTFKRGFIAPTGKYHKLEVIMMFEKVQYDFQHFLIQDNSNYPYTDIQFNLGTGEYSYKNISIVYTTGRQQIFYDKIVLDYGVRLGFTPAFSILTIMAGDEFVGNIEDYYRRASRIRIFREQLINFHIGIGFLAF